MRRERIMLFVTVAIIAFLVWYIVTRQKTQKVVLVRVKAPDNQTIVNNTITQAQTGDGFYLSFNFSNLTDQTFAHNAGRYVESEIVVSGETIEANISYPSLNTIRVQSITPITGTIILT